MGVRRTLVIFQMGQSLLHRLPHQVLLVFHFPLFHFCMAILTTGGRSYEKWGDMLREVDARWRVGYLGGAITPLFTTLRSGSSSVSSPSWVWGGDPTVYGFLAFYRCQTNSPASEIGNVFSALWRHCRHFVPPGPQHSRGTCLCASISLPPVSHIWSQTVVYRRFSVCLITLMHSAFSMEGQVTLYACGRPRVNKQYWLVWYLTDNVKHGI